MSPADPRGRRLSVKTVGLHTPTASGNSCRVNIAGAIDADGEALPHRSRDDAACVRPSASGVPRPRLREGLGKPTLQFDLAAPGPTRQSRRVSSGRRDRPALVPPASQLRRASRSSEPGCRCRQPRRSERGPAATRGGVRALPAGSQAGCLAARLAIFMITSIESGQSASSSSGSAPIQPGEATASPPAPHQRSLRPDDRR